MAEEWESSSLEHVRRKEKDDMLARCSDSLILARCPAPDAKSAKPACQDIRGACYPLRDRWDVVSETLSIPSAPKRKKKDASVMIIGRES